MIVDSEKLMRYPSCRPLGGSGAADTFELCQVREEAALRRLFWVPPANLPGGFLGIDPLISKQQWKTRDIFAHKDLNSYLFLSGSNTPPLAAR